jgi:hypothetical protein
MNLVCGRRILVAQVHTEVKRREEAQAKRKLEFFKIIKVRGTPIGIPQII